MVSMVSPARLSRSQQVSVCIDFLLTQVFNFTFINHCKNDIILQDWDVIIPASGFKEASVSVGCDGFENLFT